MIALKVSPASAPPRHWSRKLAGTCFSCPPAPMAAVRIPRGGRVAVGGGAGRKPPPAPAAAVPRTPLPVAGPVVLASPQGGERTRALGPLTPLQWWGQRGAGVGQGSREKIATPGGWVRGKRISPPPSRYRPASPLTCPRPRGVVSPPVGGCEREGAAGSRSSAGAPASPSLSVPSPPPRHALHSLTPLLLCRGNQGGNSLGVGRGCHSRKPMATGHEQSRPTGEGAE